MNSNDEFYDADRSLLERERAKKARLEAKVEAASENMTETLAAMLKQDKLRRQLAMEARDATRDPERHKRMQGKADTWSREKEVPTGYEDNPYVTVDSYSSVDYSS